MPTTSRIRGALLVVVALIAPRPGAFGQGTHAQPQILSTGITGTLTASGIDSPTYLMSFAAVQRLILESTRGPVGSARAAAIMAPGPITLADLERVGLMRRLPGGFVPSFLVLTVDDQKQIYRVSARYGAALAHAIEVRRADFDRVIARYPYAPLRSELLFDLIAGVVLNWEGLRLSSQLGLRASPTVHPNGDRYLLHSAENGAGLRLEGLYWGSESWPSSEGTFTTFGDAKSFPRTLSLPNVFDPVFDDGLRSYRDSVALYGAIRNELFESLSLALNDAGSFMMRLREGAMTRSALEQRLRMEHDRFHAADRLLEAIGYVRSRGDTLQLAVPVLGADDQPLIDSTTALGDAVLRDWFAHSYGSMERELRNVSPLRNGLTFPLVFSEVWHYTFGFASKTLAEDGFYENPRGPGAHRRGYAPLVLPTATYTKLSP
jgi:hypothetical protein